VLALLAVTLAAVQGAAADGGASLGAELRPPTDARLDKSVRLEVQVAPAEATDVAVGATLITPQMEAQRLTFRDDGQEPDRAAGDGIWTAQFTPAAPGRYELSILAEGGPGGARRTTRKNTGFDVRRGDKLGFEWTQALPDGGRVYPGENLQFALHPVFGSDRGVVVHADMTPLRGPGGARFKPEDVKLTPGLLRRDGGPGDFGIALSVPVDQPVGRYEAVLHLWSEYDRTDVPVAFEVLRPQLTLTPTRLDLDRIVRGEEGRAGLRLSLPGRGKQPVRVTLQPWMDRPGGRGPGLYADGLTREFILQGGSAETINIIVPTRQDTALGEYRSTLLIETPFQRSRVPVVGSVVRPPLSPHTVILLALIAAVLAFLLLSLW